MPSCSTATWWPLSARPRRSTSASRKSSSTTRIFTARCFESRTADYFRPRWASHALLQRERQRRRIEAELLARSRRAAQRIGRECRAEGDITKRLDGVVENVRPAERELRPVSEIAADERVTVPVGRAAERVVTVHVIVVQAELPRPGSHVER